MNYPQKTLLFLAFIMGFISVAAGAFGAHALKNKLEPSLLSIFEVAARYQMYHALAIPIAVWISTLFSGNFALLSGWLFLAGIVVFSGSLYVLSLTGIKIFGAITPIGGLLLLLGWLALGLAVFFRSL